jgi:hypothetical protein
VLSRCGIGSYAWDNSVLTAEQPPPRVLGREHMRRSHRIVGAVAATLATSVAGVSAVSDSAGAATSAKSEYQASLKAAAAQNVHYVSKATEQGTGLVVIGDTGKKSGSEKLTVKQGSTTESISVMLIGATGYLKGNDAALQKVLGLTTTQAATYMNRWLSFPASNTSLATLVSGLRNADVPSELQMGGPYTLGGTKKIGGQITQAIKGTAATSSGTKVPIILYVNATGTPLPIEEVTNPKGNSSSIVGTVTFSNWGEKTDPQAPATTVPLVPLLPAA